MRGKGMRSEGGRIGQLPLLVQRRRERIKIPKVFYKGFPSSATRPWTPAGRTNVIPALTSAVLAAALQVKTSLTRKTCSLVPHRNWPLWDPFPSTIREEDPGLHYRNRG